MWTSDVVIRTNQVFAYPGIQVNNNASKINKPSIGQILDTKGPDSLMPQVLIITAQVVTLESAELQPSRL